MGSRMDCRKSLFEELYNKVEETKEMINDALYSEDDEKRRDAVSRITNQEILGKVVMKEKCEDILLCAFDKIYDEDVMKLIAEKAESIDVRLMADEQLYYDEIRFNDVSKKKWIHAGSIKSRGPEISIALGASKASQRAKAVEAIEDQMVLAIVAKEDDRPEVRKAALKKLKNLDELEYIILNEEDQDALNTAIESYYHADKIRYDMFGENPETRMTCEIAGKATDQELLRKIAGHTIDFSAREAAFNNIWDTDILYQFYVHDNYYDLRDQYVLIDRAIEHILQSEEKVNELALQGNPVALKRVLNQDVIKKIVLDKKKDVFSRCWAIKRLNDIEVVKALFNDAGENEEIRKEAGKKIVRPVATKKLSMLFGFTAGKDNAKLCAIIDSSDGTSDNFEETLDAIEKLDDEEKLFEYAMQDRNYPFSYYRNLGYIYCIEVIIGKIYNNDYLLKIATEAPVDKSRHLAAERVALSDLRTVYIASMSDVDVRRVCARREPSEEQLYFYALDDQDTFVREIAAYRMTDNELLRKLAILSDDETISRIAISRMTDQQEINIVANNGHSTVIRQLAVNHKMLTNPKLLAYIALNDNNYNVCLDALNKIDDENYLRDIVLDSEDDLIRYSAIKKISNTEKLKHIYKRLYGDRDARKEVIEKIDDEEFLSLAAKTEYDSELAVFAAKKVKNQLQLFEIIKHTEDLDVKHAALEGLTEEDFLSAIYNSDEPTSIIAEAGCKLFGKELYKAENEKNEGIHKDEKDRNLDGFVNESTLMPEDEKPLLKYVTRGNSSPTGKNNIYLTAQDDDLHTYLKDISDEILKSQNCAVWYLEDGVQYDEEEYFADLSQMQLFVVPITGNFLRTENRARLIDFRYAIDHHKAILPIMMENGLEDEFNSICGELHTINSIVNDVTAKSYEEKIKEFLSNVLIGDEFADKIRKAFDAYIFLSYRKKDRAFAHELMKLIHKNEFCRDIAIWYDEFLIPGLNFNEAIYDALDKSQIFALVVTPNLVNEKNYIMTTEYPFARRMEKKVLPFEMSRLDKNESEELEKYYENIGGRINPDDNNEVEKLLKEVINKYATSTVKKDADHDFFIGLAYLSGIDVEIDHEKAIALIKSAADRDVAPAVMKLVSMYQYGDGVERSIEQMLTYQRKLVNILEANINRDPSDRDRKQFVQELINLYEYIIDYANKSRGNESLNTQLFDEAEYAMKKAFYLSDTFYKATDERWAVIKKMECTSKLGDLRALRGDWIEAQKYFTRNMDELKKEEIIDNNAMLLGITYTQIGRNALQENSSFVAQDYFSEAIITFEAEYEKTKSVQSREGMSEAWAYLGDGYSMDEDYDSAYKCYNKAMDISKSLIEELKTDAAKARYIDFETRRDRMTESLFE